MLHFFAKLKKYALLFIAFKWVKSIKAKIGTTSAFNPPWYGVLFNPFYLSRKGLSRYIRQLAPELNGKILDIGCGTKPYSQFFHGSEYIGLELDIGENRKSKFADYYYDGKRFPFIDSSFDSVILSQVFEHVFNPDEFMNEVARILKPGGKLLLTVPFIGDEHEKPYDFGRYSSFGLKFILEMHNFKILSMNKSITGFYLISQLVNVMIYKKISGMKKCGYYLMLLLLIAPVNIIGLIIGIIFSGNDDIYLDNIVLAINIKPELRILSGK